MKDINIRWKSYPHYLPKIRLRRRRAKADQAFIPNTDGAGSSRISKSQPLKPVADIPVHWRDKNNLDHSIVSIRELRLERLEDAAASTLNSVPNRGLSFSPQIRPAERTYDPRITPSSRTLVRSAKSTATQLGNFRPKVTSYRDGQIGKISVQKNRQSLRTISRYSSHSKARRSAAPSVQSVVRSVLSTTSSRSPSQRKALAQFTEDLARYAHKTKQLPNIPIRGLLESPSVTTVSANTIKELEPYRAQFMSAGLAITSTDQKTAGRFSKPLIRRLGGWRDTQYEKVRTSRAKTYTLPAAGGKRIKSVLKKKKKKQKPSFASGSTGTTVIGFTSPYGKSFARGNQLRRASSLSSDHTIIAFTPPHERFVAGPSSPPRNQVIVQTSRRQENYSPITVSHDDSLTRSLPTPNNDQAVVTTQRSPGRYSERPPSQRTDRSFVVPITPETSTGRDTASLDEVITVVSRSQKMLQQERYLSPDAGSALSPDAGSADTIVVTRPHTNTKQKAGHIETLPPRETNVQTPQKWIVQQPDYTPQSSQQADAFMPDETARVLPLRTGFAHESQIITEQDVQGRYIQLGTNSANRGVYNASPSQPRQAKVQGGAEYYVDETLSQTRFIQAPTQFIGNNFVVDDSRAHRFIIRGSASLPERSALPVRQKVYQERLVQRHVEDPFFETPNTGSRYVQETPSGFAGQYYYVKDSTAQQKLVLVPAPDVNSPQDVRPVIRNKLHSEQYAVLMPEYEKSQEKYFQQASISPARYAVADYLDAQELPNLVPSISPSPRHMYSRAQDFRSPPRTAVKKSLPWLRKAAKAKVEARVLQNEVVVVMNSKSDIAKPMAMSGPYPVSPNPQVSTLAREVRTQVTFNDDVGTKTTISVNNPGMSTNVELRRTPPSTKSLVKLLKVQPQVQREVAVLEPNDRGGRLLNAPERRGSRPSPILKAPAVVQTDRFQIERNNRVAPRDANNVDDLSKLVITQSFQQAPTVNSAQMVDNSSRMILASDNSITRAKSPSDESQLVMSSETNRLLPFVQERAMVRQFQLQEDLRAINAEDSEVEEVVLLDSETRQKYPTVAKTVLVQRGLTQMDSMRGLIVKDPIDTSDTTLIQATGETLQTPPSNVLPRTPVVWTPVDWTKKSTVRDAEEEKDEVLAPSQVPSPHISFFAEKPTSIQEVPPQTPELAVTSFADYGEVILPEEPLKAEESQSQMTEVETITLTNRNEMREELQISVSSRTLPPQSQIAIPPRNPRRSQVRWLGDRIVRDLSALSVFRPISAPPLLPPSNKSYADRGTQAEASPSPEFRDRGTSVQPIPEVRDRSTSIRSISGVRDKHGLVRRRTHVCSSGSFRCEQCHRSESPSPKLSPKRASALPVKVVEEWLEDVLESRPESVDAAEVPEEVVQSPSVKASIDEFAKRTPVPDPAKRPSPPCTFDNDIPPMQSPAIESPELQTSPDINTASPSPSPSKLKQPIFYNFTSSPADPTGKFGFDTRVFKGWHVATAAASDKEIDTWIEAQTGVSVRKFLVDLSVFDGVDIGVRSLADIARRAKGKGRE